MILETKTWAVSVFLAWVLLLPSGLLSIRVIFRVNQSIEAMTVVTRKNGKENHLNKVRVTWS